MITVMYSPFGIEVKGHAGYADYGEDIVCASISTLTQNLIWSIEDLTKDKIQYDVNAGDTVITYRNLSEQARLLVDSFLLGCNAVADTHPDCVRVTYMKSQNSWGSEHGT